MPSVDLRASEVVRNCRNSSGPGNLRKSLEQFGTPLLISG